MQQQAFKEVVRPDVQLALSERDLGEEIVKTLTATNPSAPKNVVHFNMRDRVFKLDPMVDQLAQHYSTDGYLLHHHSEEAKRQLDQAKAAEEAAARYQTEVSCRQLDMPIGGMGHQGSDCSAAWLYIILCAASSSSSYVE